MMIRRKPETERALNFNDFAVMNPVVFGERFAQTGAFIVLQHVPKTAGSTLSQELRSILRPYYNIHAQYDGPRMVQTMDDAVDTFLDQSRSGRLRSASGHLRPRHVERILQATPNAAVFTFLRDPVDRVISDFRYARSPAHPPHREFREKYPTFETYLEDVGQQNKMWHFLSQEPFSEEALVRAFDRLFFIGLKEDLDQNFQYLSAMFGCPKPITRYLNKTKGESERTIAADQDLAEEIARKNVADMRLYQRVKQILADKRAEMDRYIKERRAPYLAVSQPSE